MGLPDYIPPTYEVWDTWNSRKKRQVLQTGTDTQTLRKEAFIRSCLASETSSVLTDLSSEERIRSFADRAGQFDENLIGVMNRWAAHEDKEYIRDGIAVDGRTASSLMWEHGLTFLDVVVGVQKILEAPEAYAVTRISVSTNGPDKRLEENLLERKPTEGDSRGEDVRKDSKKASGIWKRVKGVFGAERDSFGGSEAAHEQNPQPGRQLSGEHISAVRRSMDELFREDKNAGGAALREHNRDCLRAEQAVRLEEEKEKVFTKADRLLTEKAQWSYDMKERSAGMVSGTILTVSTAGELVDEPITAQSSEEYGKDAECLTGLKETLAKDRPIVEQSVRSVTAGLAHIRRDADAKEEMSELPGLEEQLTGRGSIRIIKAAQGRYASEWESEKEAEGETAREARLLSEISEEQAKRAAKEQEWKRSLQKGGPSLKTREAAGRRQESVLKEQAESKERVSLSSLLEEEPGRKKQTAADRERSGKEAITKAAEGPNQKNGPTSGRR
ncbi:MAG: hypothetical protein J6B85_12990 [Lachnospiraceae bacterium]|nr:hypothetical protein [Lachnospiraceae bacterium]